MPHLPDAVRRLSTVLLLSLTAVAGSWAAAPVRLALVPAVPELNAAVDVLTVGFTRAGADLLERAEIDRVYREQAMASTGKDFLKLGQILGADGVLILEIAQEGEKRNLSVRLAAVKPGVILRQRNYPWPIQDLGDWGNVVAGQFVALMPKLGVLPKDALPISILNLRSAVRSPEAEAMERDLTLLVQNRLTQERDVFVLERRRLGTLAEEKELKPEQNSSFWNGSYLFEGTIDRAGFSVHEVTVNARLIPPAGASPTDIELAVPRTNLIAMADSLVNRILGTLRRKSSAPEWKPAEEAARYLEEARWALRWKMFAEAQAASDTAWALGKQDLECALVRVKSYVEVVPPDTGGYRLGEGGGDRLEFTTKFLAELTEAHPFGLAYTLEGTTVNYTYVINRPDPNSVNRARRALSLYYEFTKTLPASEPQMGAPWYRLGVEALVAASRVLEHFHFVPEAQPPVREGLSEVRGLARSIAAALLRSPSVRDAYWVGNRLTEYGPLLTNTEDGNIFPCEADWGCFWQERPEDTIALYRDLMSTPAFAYIHHRLWKRPLQRPLFACWNDTDPRRVPELWSRYLKEVDGSSNAILRLEGKFLELANPFDAKARPAFQDIASMIASNHGVIVSNNVDVFYLDWHLGGLVDVRGVPEKEKLRQWYYREVRPSLQAGHEAHRAYAQHLIEEQKNSELFDRQRRYLAEQTPYSVREFIELFAVPSYSRSQAAELKPLLAAYKSNLVQSAEKAGVDPVRSRSSLARIGLIEQKIDRILNPAAVVAKTESLPRTNRPAQSVPQPAAALPVPPIAVGATTNVLPVLRYFRLPVERLEAENMSGLFVFAHRWRDGRLWLDLRYTATPADGFNVGFFAALAAWDPKMDHWQLIRYPARHDRSAPAGWMGEPGISYHFEVFGDAVYLSEWDGMRKYDLKSGRWETLKHPGQKLAQLFAVGGHLYAANEEGIYEIFDGGRGTRVLASCRRRPAVSTLDAFDRLSVTALFSGPAGSLRAAIGPRLYSWDSRDWKEAANLLADSVEDFTTGTLLRFTRHYGNAEIWRLSEQQEAPELCLTEEGSDPRFFRPPNRRGEGQRPRPVWPFPTGLSIAHAPAAVIGSNLCFYVAHSGVTNIGDRVVLTEKDGRHANLYWLERGQTTPLIIPLRFDLSRGFLTSYAVQGGSFTARYSGKTWMVPTPGAMLIGQAGTPGIWSIPESELQPAIAKEKILAP